MNSPVVREVMKMLTDEKMKEPLEMLKEVEAYLTFRLLCETPTVPEKDMEGMKKDIAQCLRYNGIEVDFQH